MNCPSCGKPNKPEAKFCKHCGSSLEQKFKTCKNGHNYDAALNECPYCPKSEVATAVKTATQNQKTVIDKQADIVTAPEISKTKTEAVKPAATSPTPQKTIVQEEPGKEKPVPKTPASTKLVGWIVSYDLDSAGIDFKIYEGRNKIGRSNLCNIVVNNASISEEHALLYYGDNKLILQDELSAKGTIVNGKRISERVLLKDGDEIKLGDISFKIKIV